MTTAAVFDYLFAWLSVLCLLLLCLKFFTRRFRLKKADRFLHNIHIPLGVMLIVLPVLHAITSSQSLLSLNFGTACFAVGILLALSYFLRRQLKRYFLPVHRLLTAAMIVLLIVHIVDVGGVRVFELFEAGAGYDETIETTAVAETDALYQDETAFETEAEAETEAETEREEYISPSVASLFDGHALNDGVYEGSGDGYRGTITVEVTVEGGKVTDIEILSIRDDRKFYQRAVSALSELILGSQTTDVDAVSGATYSSRGYLEAVSDAVEQAYAD